MSVSARRQRSTTATSTPPTITDSTSAIELCLEKLSSTLTASFESQTARVSKLAPQLKILHETLTSSPDPVRAKDIFRHLHGFSYVLDTLRALSGYYHSTKRTQHEKENLFELLGDILRLLAEVFRGHHGNRRYFKRRVEGAGWVALEQAIASIGFGGSEPDTWSENRLLGLLLAFAVDDWKLQSLCQDLHDQLKSKDDQNIDQLQRQATELQLTEGKSATPPVSESEAADDTSESDQASDIRIAALMQNKIHISVEETTVLVNKDIARTIIDFWKVLSRDRSLSDAPAALFVILSLLEICSLSKSNLLALHSTGVLSIFLPLAFADDTRLSFCEITALERLCSCLISLGINSLEDARYLVLNKSPEATEFLLQSIKHNQRPPHIQFDLSLNGFASIEFPSLGRPFPPSSSVAGYTFTAWFHVDHFDNKTHTTIFGAFDSSQTCFLLAYIEKDTHNFILQTSVTSSRPSVRFKSTVFEEGKWYHVAIVHRRPRTIQSSKAALYVNGEFAEQVKCQYPSSPPPMNSSTDSLASFASTSSTRMNAVQAFLGTPQDLSSQLGKGKILSRWSLASAHLFEDVLSDDFLSVHYRLGPGYDGNYQDCLGSFQTYEASAGLGMRNELMHPGKDEKSDILTAIREKASSLVPESRVILSVLPSAVMGDDTRGEGDPAQLIRGLSRSASSNLHQLTRNGTVVAVNAAVPCINEALTRVHGTGVLTGNPVVIIPQSMDDAMWRLGGCVAVCLKLVEYASSREEIVRAVDILFECIRGNWRNSEAMERLNGYAILGALLRGKLGAGAVMTSMNANKSDTSDLSHPEREKLSFELLSLVLGFLGYDHKHPENSIINNPLAYRTLLVDFDIWRKTAVITQKLYYKQFIIFGVRSKYHVFNSRRLRVMRKYPFLILLEMC
jgi:hypothetical protein